MMLGSIYRAQYKAFRRYTLPTGTTCSVQVGRMICAFGIPPIVGGIVFVTGLPDGVTGMLPTTLAVIANMLMVAFNRLAVWRQTLAKDKSGKYDADKWLIDATVAHVLAAVSSAIIACVLLCVPVTRAVQGFASMFATHTTISLLFVLSALYAAYVQVNRVDPRVNGNDRTA